MSLSGGGRRQVDQHQNHEHQHLDAANKTTVDGANASEIEQLREELQDVLQETRDLQDALSADDELRWAEATMPTLETVLDELLASHVARAQTEDGDVAHLRSNSPTSTAATATAPFQSPPYQRSVGTGAHNDVDEDFFDVVPEPPAAKRSDPISTIRVVCRHHDAKQSDLEEETFFFLRLSAEVETFDDLRREALRIWQVPPPMHYRFVRSFVRLSSFLRLCFVPMAPQLWLARLVY